MRKQLENLYMKLLIKYGFKFIDVNNINSVIKKSLHEFTHSCSNPAVWCFGKHTEVLMSEFIYEMKKVRYVIDIKYQSGTKSGFNFISKYDIKKYKIDGVIISSFIYKEQIKNDIRKNYPGLRYLDIYEKLEANGISLQFEFFSQTHPYGHYARINDYLRKLAEAPSKIKKAKLYEALIEEYIWIKDFKTAIECLRQYLKIADSKRNRELLADVISLYNLQLSALAKISEKNVLMLCIDGCRRKDVLMGGMPKFNVYILNNAFFYQNAYSVSTSTYESLIPAYSENADLRTEYFQSSIIHENKCRFIQEAKKQNRKVFFYTDSTKYIESDIIHLNDKSQTATEKFWDFLLDASGENNGLFYIHVLYESHFSYSNPYTKAPLVVKGANILFDYLYGNESLSADFNQQQKDAMHYLDDVLTPLIEPLECRMVFFADHGNIILEKGTYLEDVEELMFTFHDDLIQVPLVIKSPEKGVGYSNELISIMDLNRILIDLMNGKKVMDSRTDYIKVVRSELYNPDFRYLYKKCGQVKGLQAFELFIFMTDIN